MTVNGLMEMVVAMYVGSTDSNVDVMFTCEKKIRF